MRDGGCTGNSFCSSAGVMNRRGAWGARQPTGAKRHCNACVLLSTFSASTSNFAAIFWLPGRALPPNSAAPVFQAARGYEAYRINTPAQVLSGARSGVGGAIRVRTIRMGWPQLGQRNCACGLTRAVSAVGMIFNTHCNNAISHGPRLAAGYWDHFSICHCELPTLALPKLQLAITPKVRPLTRGRRRILKRIALGELVRKLA